MRIQLCLVNVAEERSSSPSQCCATSFDSACPRRVRLLYAKTPSGGDEYCIPKCNEGHNAAQHANGYDKNSHTGHGSKIV